MEPKTGSLILSLPVVLKMGNYGVGISFWFGDLGLVLEMHGNVKEEQAQFELQLQSPAWLQLSLW